MEVLGAKQTVHIPLSQSDAFPDVPYWSCITERRFQLASVQHRERSTTWRMEERRCSLSVCGTKKCVLTDWGISFREYETIQTARYDLHKPDFARLAATSGLRVERVWMDDRETFSIQYLEPRVPCRSKSHKAQ